MNIDWTHLSAPFAPDDVEWKPGATTRDKKKGLAMAYITARAVQERLDEVFTPGGWKNEFRAGPDGGVICRIYFKTGHVDASGEAEWAWREDGADNTDVEAVKGGLSNAMKRTGAALGIGRYLYKLPSQWVPLDDRGRFAQTPRIPREYLPASGGSQGAVAPRSAPPENRRPQSREAESRPQPSAPEAQAERPRPEAPQRSQPNRGQASRTPSPRTASGERTDDPRAGSRAQAGQKKVIRRVGGQARPDARGNSAAGDSAGGDGATRPPAPPRPF